jgi:hypothetical protein
LIGRDHEDPCGAAEDMGVDAGSDLPVRFPIAQHDLGIEQKGLGILYQHLGLPFSPIVCLLALGAGFLPNRFIHLIQLHKASRADLIGFFGVGHIMAVTALAFSSCILFSAFRLARRRSNAFPASTTQS